MRIAGLFVLMPGKFTAEVAESAEGGVVFG